MYLAFSMPGMGEILIILAILLLVFGAKKLPELARSMGSSINEFKAGLKEEPGKHLQSRETDEDRPKSE